MLGHLRKLLKGLVESLRAPEHEPQVKHRRDEGAAVLKRLLEVIDGIIDLCGLKVSIGLWLARDLLGFSLVGQALGVVELGITVFPCDSRLKVSMCQFKVLLVEAHVTTVEVVVCISVVVANCCLVLLEGSRIVTLVVQGQSQILVIEGEVLEGAVLLDLQLFDL